MSATKVSPSKKAKTNIFKLCQDQNYQRVNKNLDNFSVKSLNDTSKCSDWMAVNKSDMHNKNPYNNRSTLVDSRRTTISEKQTS